MNILREAFEVSSYGYWIMPNGEIIDCNTMSHGEAASKQIGKSYDQDDEEAERDIVDEALSEGAVRIVAAKGSDEFNAEWSDTAITNDAKSSLIKVMGIYNNRDAFILQSEYFEIYREAVRYIREH